MENKLIQNPNSPVLREDYATVSLVHYSQLLNFLGYWGLIIPLIMWSTKKHEIKDMDLHGKNIVNYQLSVLLYTVIFFLLFFISFILSFFIIGFLFIAILVVIAIPLALLSIIPPILGGIAASKGQLYNYPLKITFIK